MIIFGRRTILLLTQYILGTCHYCSNRDTLQMNIFQRYLHIFWIPVVPIGKTGVSQCAHCKQVLTMSQMPDDLKLSYDNLKLEAKTPWWAFSGLFLIGVFVLFSIFAT